MKVCGYCRWYQGFANKHQYGICRANKSEYPDGGTFSTNTCPHFEHWRIHNKIVSPDSKQPSEEDIIKAGIDFIMDTRLGGE